jgi:hypothetical protein
MMLSIISLAVALFALFVNVAGLVRRPRIVAKWGYVVDQPPEEGLSVIVTARRRPIEVDEIGLVLLEKVPVRHQCAEWVHEEYPPRLLIEPYDGGPPDRRSLLPTRLQDGQSVRAYINLDRAQEALPATTGKAVTYIRASGTVYLAAGNLRLRAWLKQDG